MITSSQLKIWTIITHAFIIVGMGHGVLCLVVYEVMSLGYFISKSFIDSPDMADEILRLIVSLACVVGQCAIVFSIFTKRNKLKLFCHIVGLIFLWASIVCFYLIALKDSYTQLFIVTCLPFFVCTIIFFCRTKHRTVL